MPERCLECCDAQSVAEMGQNEPCHSLRRHGRSTSDCMSFPEEATHPRYYGEGYPDWPGRASNKEGESWTSIAGLSSESIRQSCAMRLRSRRMVVTATFAILARSTPRKRRRGSSPNYSGNRACAIGGHDDALPNVFAAPSIARMPLFLLHYCPPDGLF